MRLVVILILLSLGFHAQAQDKKNEVQIGLPGAYFFDKSPFRFHHVTTFPFFPKVRYLRAFNSNFGASVEYSYVLLAHHNNYKELYYEGEVVRRIFHAVQMHFTFNKLVFENVKAIAFFGPSYRFSGGELVHLKYNYTQQGIPWEPVWVYNAYNDFGLSLGVQAQLKFLKNFHLAAEVGFTRYFSKFSPNQLNTALLVGYRF